MLWGGPSDHVIIGGDWNVSCCAGITHIGRANARLKAWSTAAGLACERKLGQAPMTRTG